MLWYLVALFVVFQSFFLFFRYIRRWGAIYICFYSLSFIYIRLGGHILLFDTLICQNIKLYFFFLVLFIWTFLDSIFIIRLQVIIHSFLYQFISSYFMLLKCILSTLKFLFLYFYHFFYLNQLLYPVQKSHSFILVHSRLYSVC